ncbi:MAG: hypothetical protein HY554_14600 [Elusimicrobia bacterium]|nr:hypothetical protein [Elusimicrobiota bacterium]
MNALLPALLLGASLPASAQQPAEVRRGRLEVKLKVGGTVVAEDIFRLKSSIDGRVEAVLASSYTWAGPDAPLGLLVDNTLAALIDSRQTTPTEVLEDRWQSVYQPTRIKCAEDCFVMAVFARPRKRVLPHAVLFEAARALRLVGRVRPNDRHWIKEGQTLEFWPVADKDYRQKAVVDHFILDVQGRRTDSGGTMKARLDRRRWLEPGTPWEGRVVAEVKQSVLQVPTRALIRYKDATYLPIRVSTGVTTDELTEITAGIEERRPILILDAPELRGAQPHAPSTQPLPPPKTLFFDDGRAGGNRALDDSTKDRPAGDEDD